MTSDEARERVGEIRAATDRLMRVLCVPGPDWYEAADAAGKCVDMCAALENQCFIEGLRKGARHGY